MNTLPEAIASFSRHLKDPNLSQDFLSYFLLVSEDPPKEKVLRLSKPKDLPFGIDDFDRYLLN